MPRITDQSANISAQAASVASVILLIELGLGAFVERAMSAAVWTSVVFLLWLTHSAAFFLGLLWASRRLGVRMRLGSSAETRSDDAFYSDTSYVDFNGNRGAATWHGYFPAPEDVEVTSPFRRY